MLLRELPEFSPKRLRHDSFVGVKRAQRHIARRGTEPRSRFPPMFLCVANKPSSEVEILICFEENESCFQGKQMQIYKIKRESLPPRCRETANLWFCCSFWKKRVAKSASFSDCLFPFSSFAKPFRAGALVWHISVPPGGG